MKPRHQVSRAAIELIKRFEGYRQDAARLPDGRWTIGYGHTHSARAGAKVSEQDAEALLLYDLISIAHGVNEQVYATLGQNQFDALCAFAFNIGLDAFRRSTALKRVNEGASIEAAFAMELWRRAEFEGESIVIDALVRRRAAEKLLFLTPPGEGWTPAPSAVLRPLPDHERDFTPHERPMAVTATLVGDRITVERADTAPAAPVPAESPVQAAAEQVSARLQTLFADARSEPAQFFTDAPPEPEPEPEPEAEIEPGFDVEPAPAAGVPPEVDEYLPAYAPPPRDLFEPEVVEAEPEPAPIVQPVGRRVRAPRPIGFGGMVALAVPGLVFFGGGAFWGLNAHAGATPGPVTPVMVAALACLTGALLFGIAAYLLMQKLGRDAEDEGGERA